MAAPTVTVAESVLTYTSESPFRRSLKMCVSALATEAGFTSAEDDALETLTELLQSFMSELAHNIKAFTELSGRTDAILGDVVMALVEMGQNVCTIPAYSKRLHRLVIPCPMAGAGNQEPRRLRVGTKRPHPVHIPEYLPEFPDPHTYIKTLTYKPPVSDYQIVREKASAQKRDIERALTRFIAKTGDTENLFPDDPYAFPLIANKPKPLPYLDALLPRDQEMDMQEPEKDENWLGQPQDRPDKQLDPHKSESSATVLSSASSQQPRPEASTSFDDSLIDNPYLRPIVMPKLKGGYKKGR